MRTTRFRITQISQRCWNWNADYVTVRSKIENPCAPTMPTLNDSSWHQRYLHMLTKEKSEHDVNPMCLLSLANLLRTDLDKKNIRGYDILNKLRKYGHEVIFDALQLDLDRIDRKDLMDVAFVWCVTAAMDAAFYISSAVNGVLFEGVEPLKRFGSVIAILLAAEDTNNLMLFKRLSQRYRITEFFSVVYDDIINFHKDDASIENMDKLRPLGIKNPAVLDLFLKYMSVDGSKQFETMTPIHPNELAVIDKWRFEMNKWRNAMDTLFSMIPRPHPATSVAPLVSYGKYVAGLIQRDLLWDDRQYEVTLLSMLISATILFSHAMNNKRTAFIQKRALLELVQVFCFTTPISLVMAHRKSSVANWGSIFIEMSRYGDMPDYLEYIRVCRDSSDHALCRNQAILDVATEAFTLFDSIERTNGYLDFSIRPDQLITVKKFHCF